MINFKQGEKIHLSVLAIDLTASTKLWQDIPQDKVIDLRNRYRYAIDDLIERTGGEVYLHKTTWLGDGIWGYFYSKIDTAQDTDKKIIALGIQLWQILKFDYMLKFKISATCTEIEYKEEYKEDPGRIDSPDLDYLGHIISICPEDLFLITENIYQGLPEEKKQEVRCFGTTKRDKVLVYVYPKIKEAPPEKDFLPQKEDINLLKDEYLKYLRDERGFLRFIYQRELEKVVTLKLKEVFTPLMLQKKQDFALRPLERIIENPPQQFEDVFINRRYISIIGDPGAGKSTLLKWLAFIYAEGRHTITSQIKKLDEKDTHLLPIIASIGSLYEICKDKNVTLLKALEECYKQKQLPELGRLFEAKLNKGEAIVLLDGLDEVSGKDKGAVKEVLEGFIRHYRDNRFVITSRISGYQEIVFPQGTTSTYTLCPLNEDQIDRLVNAWFIEFEKQQIGTEDSKYCETIGKDKASTFLNTIKQSIHLMALAKNPLLLSLLCLAHRQGSSFPKYRVEVYDLIAKTLIDIWDRVRSLGVGKDVSTGDYRHETPLILNPLGLWLHENEKYYSTNTAPRQDVEAKIIELMEKKGISDNEAKSQAKRFLDDLREPKKTHIFIERGTDLWGFIHLTFQEFFAAWAIVGEDKEDEYLKKYAYSSHWREVIKLIFGILGIMQSRINKVEQLLNKILTGFGDELNEEILKKNILLAAEISAELPTLSEEINQKIVNKLIPLIDSNFKILRQEIFRILNTMKGSNIGKTVIKLLESKLNKWNIIKIPEDNKELFKWIDNSDKWCRIIGTLYNIQSEEFRRELSEKLKSAFPLGELERCYMDVYSSILEFLKAKNFLTRVAAIKLIKDIDIKDAQAISSILIEHLKSRDFSFKVSGAIGSSIILGIGNEKVNQILLNALESKESDIRTMTAWSMGIMGIKNRNIKEILLNGLKKSLIGEDVAEALANIVSPNEAIKLIPELQARYKQAKYKGGYFHLLWKLSNRIEQR